jgi:16S rRNA C967 or C1407 C5-methylase (RsmB/RsmF family)/NOL1/NOP2/fmu family ribosome biogenesis protein
MEIQNLGAFTQRIHQQLKTEATHFLDALVNEPNISVRTNPLKAALLDLDFASDIPWCPSGKYLNKKPVFTLDPLFHAGCYYPQEASSMVLDWLVRNVCELPLNPFVLDLCAAPGGKSTLLASILNNKGLLVANEVIKSRASILSENIIKWGAPNCVVTRNDPADFSSLTSMFDLLVVDAPCSGEGMFRKDKRAIEEWSQANADMCALRQRRILSDVWPSLKENGYLIYSTCTFNPDENENNIKWFSNQFEADVLPLKVPHDWGTTEITVNNGNGLAFYPHKVKGEGFFVAILQKRCSEKPLPQNRKPDKKTKKLEAPINLKNLLNDNFDAQYFEDKNGWRAFSNEFSYALNLLKNRLDVSNYGVLMGQSIKNIFIPSHELAVSTAIKKNGFATLQLQKSEALRYLKGEALTPPTDLEKGYILMHYNNTPIGFAKNIGNRMNNLYPSEWRIRMSLPQ